MADQFPRWRIKRYILHGGAELVPVIAPIDCCFIGWMNEGLVRVVLSTPPHDSTSFAIVDPGRGGMIVAPASGPKELTPRFQLGEEIARTKLNSDQPDDEGIFVVQFVF